MDQSRPDVAPEAVGPERMDDSGGIDRGGRKEPGDGDVALTVGRRGDDPRRGDRRTDHEHEQHDPEPAEITPSHGARGAAGIGAREQELGEQVAGTTSTALSVAAAITTG